MHFYKKLILGVIIFISYSNIQAQKNYKSAIVSFYNFENLYDTIWHEKNDDIAFTPSGSKAYTSTVFNDKIKNLATVISKIGVQVNPDGPAILGTAEIENSHVLDVLLQHPLIAHRNYKYVHYDSKDFRGVDVAMIYNPKYFKVIKSRPIYVKLPAGAKNAVYTRDILWVTGNMDGETVHVFVNHWPSRSGGEKRSEPGRMAAAETVRKYIDSIQIKDENAKIIVMGDLNDDPINNSVVKGLRAKGDIKKIKTDELYNPFYTYYKNGIGTLAYQDVWNLFDQILVSKPWLEKNTKGWFFYKAQIFKEDFMLETLGQYKGYPMRTYSGDVYRGGYSDHFPTYLVLLKESQ